MRARLIAPKDQCFILDEYRTGALHHGIAFFCAVQFPLILGLGWEGWQH
jgi:hypothetical protein